MFLFFFALLACVATASECNLNFVPTGCVVRGEGGFSCENAEPWVEGVLLQRIQEVAVSLQTPGTLCCVEEGRILCEPPSEQQPECPAAGYLDTGCVVNQDGELECVNEAPWLAELEHDLERGGLAHAMMLERMEGALQRAPGSRCCVGAHKEKAASVFCEPPAAASRERCSSRCSVRQDVAGISFKECREVCILAPGVPDKEGFLCSTRCSRRSNACARVCQAVTSHGVDLEHL